jgi:tape measure domain-containing protein
MSKELVFKVVLEGDTKDYVSNIQQSEATTKAVFDAIKQEADKLRQASAETAKQIGEIVPESTTKMASALTQNLNNATTAIQNAGTNAGATAKNFSEFGQVSEQALGVLKSDLVQAKQKLQEFASTNATPQDIARAQAEVDKLEKEVIEADQAFNKFSQETSKANQELKQTSSVSDKAQAGFSSLRTGATLLVGALAAIGVGLGVKELADAADSYATLSARIQQATKDGGNFEQAMSGVHRVALATNSNLETTSNLFSRINTIGKDMNLTQAQSLDLTETITKAIQIGGGTAQATDAALQQFIQGLQEGVIRGENFNSIMEQSPGLADAIAKSLGVTTGELRKMAENGELGAERVLKGMISQKDAISATYAELPLTIGNALQKIATSWQILIGEMDQANGASATVAQALSTIADNLDILKVLFDDVANGVGWFRNQLSEIDPSTIDAIRSALSQTYDTVKVLIANIAEFGTTVWSAFTTALDAVSPLFAALFSGGENVGGLTTLMNMLRMAMAAVSDVAFGLNIGFKTILASIQFLAGGVYALSSAILGFLGFDTLAQQAMNASDRMFAQAEKNGKDVVRLSQEHKWAVVETYNEIGKTAEQKNADRVANNEKTLSDLKAQEAQHVTDYKAISDERIKLQQQLVDARKSGDQSAIDAALAGLAELDKAEKAYQAESKKISDEKIKAAQDLVNAQIEAATKGGVALSDNAKKTIEASVAARGLAVEFDKTGKAIVKAIEQEAGSAVVSLDTRLAQGRKGAAALGIDIDVALNKVSEGFKEKGRAFDDFTNNLELMGATGKQAADLTYTAWQKWLETAKSPAEIDAAKAKLIEFEKQGVLSAKQVEMGMRYLDEVNGKLPANISEVEKSYKLLGITSREEANKMAAALMKAFDVTVQSGTASAENIKQALINMADKIYASGDAAKIAWYEAKLSANGLQSSVDSLGKASVKTMDDLSDSVDRVGRNARGSAADGFRELGRVAKQEAKDVAETWEQAMSRIDKERKAQSAQTAKNLGSALTANAEIAQDFYNQLVAGGMEKSRAEALKEEAMVKMSNQLRDVLNGGTAQTRIDALTGRNSSRDWMDNILKLQSKSGSVSTPKTPNIKAPTIQQPAMPNIDTGSPKTVTYKIEFGGKSLELAGDPSQQNLMNDFLSELEQLNRAR